MRNLLPILVVVLIGAPVLGSAPAAYARSSFAQAVNGSYFLSVFNFGSVAMASGAGAAFQPPMEAVAQMLQAAGLTPQQLPKDVFLLTAVYAAGDPTLAPTASPSFTDMSQARWKPESFDRTISPGAQAMLMVKYIEWAKEFHHGFEDRAIIFTPPMERFLSLLFAVEPKMFAQFSGQNLMTDKGWVRGITFDQGRRTVTDPSINPLDQVLMLWALADVAQSITHSAYPKIQDPEAAKVLRDMADKSLQFVKANPVRSTRDSGIAIVALVWYATATSNPEGRTAALALIREGGDALLQAEKKNAVDLAAAIRGLGEAWRAMGERRYLNAARDLYLELDRLWDEKAGFYATSKGAGRYAYTAFDIGVIVGALSEVINVVGPSYPAGRLIASAQDRYVGVYDSVLTGALKNPAKTFPENLFVSGIEYDVGQGAWRIADPLYRTTGVLYLANELIFAHAGSAAGDLTGYPAVQGTLLADGQSQQQQLQQRLSATETRTQELQQKLSTAEGQTRTLQSQVNDLKSQVGTLQQRSDTLSRDLQTTRQDLQSTRQTLQSAEGNLALYPTVAGIVALIAGVAIGYLLGRGRRK